MGTCPKINQAGSLNEETCIYSYTPRILRVVIIFRHPAESTLYLQINKFTTHLDSKYRYPQRYSRRRTRHDGAGS
jgi:hypothetical protein